MKSYSRIHSFITEMCILIRKSPSESYSGIEGILNRLEKERNIIFGVGLRDKGGNSLISKDDVQHGSDQEVATDEVSPH